MNTFNPRRVIALLCCVLALLAASCGGAEDKATLAQGSVAAPEASRGFAMEPAASNNFGLPSPAEVLRNASDCGEGRIRNAGPLDPSNAAQPRNLVAEVGQGSIWLQMFPDYGDDKTSLDDLAYVFHFFTLEEFEGETTVRYDWGNQPAAGNLWVGIANWSTNRYKWYRAGDMSLINTGLADFSDYIDDASDRFLLVTLVLGEETALLESIQIGPDPEPFLEVEPNNNFDEAMDLPLDELGCLEGDVGASLTNGEEDFFALDIDQTGDFTVTLNYDSPTSNVDLKLYNPDRKQLVASENLSGDEHVSYTLLETGTYYLHVKRLSGSLSDPVDYSFDGLFTPIEFEYDEHEPNNLPFSPEDLPTLVNNGFRARLGGFADTADYFRFTVPAAGEVSVDLDFSHHQANIDLYITGANGLPIFAASESTDDDEAVVFQFNSPGQYLIYVRYNHPPDSPFLANYSMDIGYTPGGGYDEVEPNNSIEEAQVFSSLPVTNFIAGLGNFGEDGGDEDFYRFTVTRAGLLDVSLSHNTFLANLDLAIMRVDGQFLLGSATSDPVESLSYELPSAGTYYIYCVRNPSGGLGCDYELELSFEPGPACNGGSESEPNGPGGAFNELPAPNVCDFTGVLGGDTVETYNGWDEFRFEVGYPGEVNITLSFSHALNDLALWLTTESGTLLEDQDDLDDNEEITFQLTEPGQYRIICISNGVNDFAPYTLDVNFDDDAPPAP